MRIERLDLTRFGIFTGHSIDLSAPGLHVIVGPNEAGKTTAMMAIQQLFYGIPERTEHNFIHAGPSMAIGARLVDADGEHLEIVRLKKRNDPLRDLSDRVVDPNELARYLHNTPEQVFTNLFTIGHDTISAGGRELLNLDGEVGTAIFGVRSGNLALGSVLTTLDSRIEELFKKGGKNPTINAAIREYTATGREVLELSSSAADVVELDRRIAELSRRTTELNEQRRTVKTRLRLLIQVRDTRPRIAKRSDLIERRDELAAQGPLVDKEVAERLAESLELRSSAEVDQQNANAGITMQKQKLEGLVIDAALIDHRGTIEDLIDERGAYIESKGDLPELESAAEAEREALTSLLGQLPQGVSLDDGGLPELSIERRARIVEMATRWTTLDAHLKTAKEEVGKADNRLSEIRSQLEAMDEPIDVSSLQSQTTAVREQGPLEANLEAKKSERSRIETELSAHASALGLGGIPLGHIPSLAVPSIDVIRTTRDNLSTLEQDTERTTTELEELKATLSDGQMTLESLMSTEDPPSLGELTSARERRERSWELIRGVWLDGLAIDGDEVTSWIGPGSLESVYERTVVEADAVADRLRLSADAVAERNHLEQRIITTNESIREHETQLGELRAQHTAQLEEWVGRWETLGVTVEEPALMETWSSEFDELRQGIRQIVLIDEQIATLSSNIERHSGDIRALLNSIGDDPTDGLSLLALLNRAAELIKKSTALANDHRAMDASLATATSDLKTREHERDAARDQLTEWRKSWADAISEIGLAADDTPSTATAVLELLDEIRAHAKGLTDYQSRISGIRTRHREFIGSLTSLLDELPEHSDLIGMPPETAVHRLSAMLQTQIGLASKQEEILNQLETYTTSSEDAQIQIARAQTAIDEIVTITGVDNEENLRLSVDRSLEHSELSSLISALEDDLRESTGKTIEEVERDANANAQIDIESELELSREQEHELDREFGALKEETGQLTTKRSSIDSSDRAAQRSLEAEQTLAAMAADIDEYVRLVLARRLLEEQLNAVREEDQGPLMRRTSELFRILTSDRYKGVDIDQDDRGNQVIMARSTDERVLEVDALSTGTRDQLYLALRFSALEQFMERNGPLPIVLDDLLVHFDDERTRAGLRMLDDLSDTAQILLFTHHGHVAEHASKVVDSARLTVHELTR